MNPEQCNRLIAESGLFKYPEIIPMGGKWRIHKPDSPYYQEYYEDFDPYHNPTHAHMALEKLKATIQIGPDVNGYLCYLWMDDEFRAHTVADTPSAAICEAIKSALEGGDAK